MAASTSTSTAAANSNGVFINHRGPDVKKTFASMLYRRLLSHGLRPFLDLQELHHGEDLGSQIDGAIRTASVHVAIFSPGYADSPWCLNELLVMLQSGATIIPVYYRVEPAELRWTTGDRGVYSQALNNQERKRIFDPETGETKQRYASATIENWRKALSCIADKSGFELKAYNCDEGVLLDKVVEAVLKKCEKPPLNVFINHRGPDVKKTFASYLYHRLHYHGMEVFLDQQELQGGDNLTSTIEGAIRSASVHVAIFSPRYAESTWCLKELDLMLDSGAPIIPVFYHVKPAELRWTRVKSKRGVKTGAYAQALQKLERRCDSHTIENWKDKLSFVADISGLDLEMFNGDEGALLEKLVERLLNLGKNIRGVDGARRA